MLGVTEAVQAAVPDGAAPALGPQALASDWLGWLVEAAGLDRRDRLEALGDDLVAAGLGGVESPELAVEAWWHGIEHLIEARDARALGLTEAMAEQALARLEEPNLTEEDAVRWSYVVGLGEVDSEAVPAELLQRVEALVEAARQESGP